MTIKAVLEVWQGKPLDVLLREMYVERDMTIKQIACELHISVGMVHKYLSEFGINKLNQLWK